MSAAVVYRMRDAQGALLYVGCSAQFPARLQTHARATGWWGSVAAIDVEHFDDLEDALNAEAAAIAAEGPRHNIHHRTFGAEEIAERRAARALRKAERDASYEAFVRDQNYWEPDGAIVCTNCGQRPDLFPKRRRIEETVCKQCGVKAFERRAA